MRCLARALLLAALGASVHANSSSSSSSKSGKGGSGSGGSGSRYIPTPFVKRVGVPVGSGIFDEEVVSEAVGTNAEGTLCVASRFTSKVQIGDTVLTGRGGVDIALSSYDVKGKLKWVQHIGGPGDDIPKGVVVAADGDCYLAGSFQQTIRDNDAATRLTATGLSDGFVMKFKEDGSYRWATKFGSSGVDAVNAITFGPTGKAYVTGSYTAPLSASSNPSTSNKASFPLALKGAGEDMFVAELDTKDGSVDIVRGFGGDAIDRPLSISFSKNNTVVYVSGEFTSSELRFRKRVRVRAQDALTAFVVQLDMKKGQDFKPRWAHRFYGGSITASDVEAEDAGGVFVAGKLANTTADGITIIGPTFNSSGASAVYVAKLNQTDGAVAWAFIGGGPLAVGNPVIAYNPSCRAIRIGGFRSWLGTTYHGRLILLEISANTGGFRHAYIYGNGLIPPAPEYYVNSLVLSASHAVAVGYLKSPVVQYNVSQTVNLSPVGEVNNVQGIRTGYIARLPVERVVSFIAGPDSIKAGDDYRFRLYVFNPSCVGIARVEAEIKLPNLQDFKEVFTSPRPSNRAERPQVLKYPPFSLRSGGRTQYQVEMDVMQLSGKFNVTGFARILGGSNGTYSDTVAIKTVKINATRGHM